MTTPNPKALRGAVERVRATINADILDLRAMSYLHVHDLPLILQALASKDEALKQQWFGPGDKPEVGRRIIAPHEDGSGARLLFVHDHGMIDEDGDDRDADSIGVWAYLPDGFQLWCEQRGGDDAFDFSSVDGSRAASSAMGDQT